MVAMNMSKAVASAVLGCALVSMAPQAAATSISVKVWEGVNTAGSGGADEQARPSNPLAAATPNAAFTYTFSGGLTWVEATQASNTLAAFVGAGGGSIAGCVGTSCSGATALMSDVLSTSGFHRTSLFELTFTTSGPTVGVIGHDDGASIYDGSNTTAYYYDPEPTVLDTSAFSLPGAGTYNIWYVEANGAPSDLIVNLTSVPEPATLGLMGLGLIGIGFARRKRTV